MKIRKIKLAFTSLLIAVKMMAWEYIVLGFIFMLVFAAVAYSISEVIADNPGSPPGPPHVYYTYGYDSALMPPMLPVPVIVPTAHYNSLTQNQSPPPPINLQFWVSPILKSNTWMLGGFTACGTNLVNTNAQILPDGWTTTNLVDSNNYDVVSSGFGILFRYIWNATNANIYFGPLPVGLEESSDLKTWQPIAICTNMVPNYYLNYTYQPTIPPPYFFRVNFYRPSVFFQ